MSVGTGGGEVAKVCVSPGNAHLRHAMTLVIRNLLAKCFLYSPVFPCQDSSRGHSFSPRHAALLVLPRLVLFLLTTGETLNLVQWG